MLACSHAHRAFPHFSQPIIKSLGHSILEAHTVLARRHVHGKGHFGREVAGHGLLALTARCGRRTRTRVGDCGGSRRPALANRC